LSNTAYIEKTKKLSSAQIKKLTPYLNDIVGLNTRMRRFCWYYCFNGMNGADAAKKAGYKKKNKLNLAIVATQNINKLNIKEGIKRIFEVMIEVDKTGLEKKLFSTYFKRAFYDISVYQKDDGSYRPLNEIPKEDRCVIDGIDTKYYGKDASVEVTILKLANRDRSMEQLAKYISMIKEVSPFTLNLLSAEAADNLRRVFGSVEDPKLVEEQKKIE